MLWKVSTPTKIDTALVGVHTYQIELEFVSAVSAGGCVKFLPAV